MTKSRILILILILILSLILTNYSCCHDSPQCRIVGGLLQPKINSKVIKIHMLSDSKFTLQNIVIHVNHFLNLLKFLFSEQNTSHYVDYVNYLINHA